jgi:hypothetical protein
MILSSKVAQFKIGYLTRVGKATTIIQPKVAGKMIIVAKFFPLHIGLPE